MIKIFFSLIFVFAFLGCDKAYVNVSHDRLDTAFVKHDKSETALSNSYFSALLPEGWMREVTKGADSQVFQLELKKNTGAKIPVSIYLSYYPNNSEFLNYQDFIEANSKNIFGETSTPKETYGPVEKITLNGGEAFYLTREHKDYLHLNKSSNETVTIKDINIVLPSAKGFYILNYRSEESDTDKYFDVFNKIVKSFKPLKNSSN